MDLEMIQLSQKPKLVFSNQGLRVRDLIAEVCSCFS